MHTNEFFLLPHHYPLLSSSLVDPKIVRMTFLSSIESYVSSIIFSVAIFPLRTGLLDDAIIRIKNRVTDLILLARVNCS